MVRWIVTITNEGAALLASVIAAQGTLNITEARVSDYNYYGQEATLTEGTFADVYQTVPASATVINSTTIKVEASFSATGLLIAHEMATVGIIANDGNSDILLAVLTTADEPDTIEPGIGVDQGWVAFNINLTVSSTSDITVVGTTAAVLYDTDIVDNLTTADATKVLSANMGRVLADNLAANENVYGAKQKITYPFSDTTKTESGVAFTDNGNGTITLNNTATADVWFNIHRNFGLYLENGSYKMNGTPVGAGSSCYWYIHYKDTNNNDVFVNDTGDGNEFTIQGSYGDANGANVSVYLVALNGKSFSNVTIKPMIYDARITDPTFAPFAMTNRELTENKVDSKDVITTATNLLPLPAIITPLFTASNGAVWIVFFVPIDKPIQISHIYVSGSDTDVQNDFTVSTNTHGTVRAYTWDSATYANKIVEVAYTY